MTNYPKIIDGYKYYRIPYIWNGKKCYRYWSYRKCNFCKNIIKVSRSESLDKKYTGLCKYCNVQKNTNGRITFIKNKNGIKKRIGYRQYVITDYGYVLIDSKENLKFPSMIRKNGMIFEHRLVMAKHLKRPLKKREIVHHINGIKTDNKFKNLMLIIPNTPHLGYHICPSCSFKWGNK